MTNAAASSFFLGCHMRAKDHPDYWKSIKQEQRSQLTTEQKEELNLERRSKYEASNKDETNRTRRERYARSGNKAQVNQARRNVYAEKKAEPKRRDEQEMQQQKDKIRQLEDLVIGRMHNIQEDSHGSAVSIGGRMDAPSRGGATPTPSNRRISFTQMNATPAVQQNIQQAAQTPLDRAAFTWQASARKLQMDEKELDRIDDEELEDVTALMDKDVENENFARQLTEASASRFAQLQEIGKQLYEAGKNADAVAEQTLETSRTVQKRRERLLEKAHTLKRNKAIRTVEKSRQQEQQARYEMEHLNSLSSQAETPAMQCVDISGIKPSNGSRVRLFTDNKDDGVSKEGKDDSFQTANSTARSNSSSPCSVMIGSPLVPENSTTEKKSTACVAAAVTDVEIGLVRFGTRISQKGERQHDPLLLIVPSFDQSPPPLGCRISHLEEKTIVDKAGDAYQLNPDPQLIELDLANEHNPNETRSFGMLEDDLSVLDESWLSKFGFMFVDNAEDDGTLVESDADEDHIDKSYLFYKGRYWCEPSVVKATGSRLTVQQRAELTQGINFVNAASQAKVIGLVRKLLEIDLWRRNQESLHDITLFCICHKLGFKTTQGKTRVVMLSKLREVRDPEWSAPGGPRGWSMPKDYSQNFGQCTGGRCASRVGCAV